MTQGKLILRAATGIALEILYAFIVMGVALLACVLLYLKK